MDRRPWGAVRAGPHGGHHASDEVDPGVGAGHPAAGRRRVHDARWTRGRTLDLVVVPDHVGVVPRVLAVVRVDHRVVARVLDPVPRPAPEVRARVASGLGQIRGRQDTRGDEGALGSGLGGPVAGVAQAQRPAGGDEVPVERPRTAVALEPAGVAHAEGRRPARAEVGAETTAVGVEGVEAVRRRMPERKCLGRVGSRPRAQAMGAIRIRRMLISATGLAPRLSLPCVRRKDHHVPVSIRCRQDEAGRFVEGDQGILVDATGGWVGIEEDRLGAEAEERSE